MIGSSPATVAPARRVGVSACPTPRNATPGTWNSWRNSDPRGRCGEARAPQKSRGCYHMEECGATQPKGGDAGERVDRQLLASPSRSALSPGAVCTTKRASLGKPDLGWRAAQGSLPLLVLPDHLQELRPVAGEL